MRRIQLLAMAAVVLMVGLSSDAQAQFFGRRGGGGLGTTMGSLGTMETVLKEIDALDEQKEQLKAISDKVARDRRAAFGGRGRGGRSGRGGGRGNNSNLSRAEIRKALEEAAKKQAAASKATRRKLSEILLPHQFERLQELGIQRMGVGALRDDFVAGKLKITDAQKKKMAGVQQKMADKMSEIFRSFRGGGDNKKGGRRPRFDFSSIQKMQADAEKDTLAVLTADQKKAFEKLKGKAFKFPERTRGRGGRGRGGRGGRGGEKKRDDL